MFWLGTEEADLSPPESAKDSAGWAEKFPVTGTSSHHRERLAALEASASRVRRTSARTAPNILARALVVESAT